MKIFNSISDYKSNRKSVVTIGTFDGVHLGHRKIIERVVSASKNENLESIVLTFFPHPRIVLQAENELKQLNTISEKKILLNELGIENLVIHPFDKDFSELSAEEFVKDVLVNQFAVQKIIIGHDHRFGKNRSATINELIAFGEKYNFEVEQIPVQEIEEISISSTKVRNALLEGNIELANSFLGYNYSLTGVVVKGKQLGRTIGFPTANVGLVENYKLIPGNGVYIVSSFFDGKIHQGMMNIGTRPTVDGLNQTIEVHFFEFNKDIYDKTISVSFLQKIRNEQKFESLDALKVQIEKDKTTSLSYFEKFNISN